MNILITSIGKRNYLVNHFKESLANENCGIYGADCNEFAPALRVVDKAFKIPVANASDFSEKLIKLCKDNDVSGIVSINDLELPYLSKIKSNLISNGIIPIISDIDVINICFDKYLTYQFSMKHNIPTPKTYLCGETEKIMKDIENEIIKFPIISKPRKGSASKGIYLIHNLEVLLIDMEKTTQSIIADEEKNMYQEYIDSDQYSLHIFNDWNAKPVSILGMVNLFKHMSGETFHIKTIKDDQLIKLGKTIAEALHHFGPLAVDVHKKGDKYVVLELNPRISGCYSLSHYAGANYPKKILDLIKKNDIQYKYNYIDDYKDNVIMLKNYSTTFSSFKEIANSTQDYTK